MDEEDLQAPDLSGLNSTQATAMFQDPDFVQKLGMIALKHGRPEGLAWLERSHQAAKENVFEALQRLEQDDGPGAISAFNRGGKFRNAKTAEKNLDGTWTLGDATGKTMVVNPAKMRMSLLSPKEYIAEQHRQQQVEALTKDRDRRYDLEKRRLKVTEDHYKSQADNTAERNRLLAENTGIKLDAARDLLSAQQELARIKALAEQNKDEARYDEHFRAFVLAAKKRNEDNPALKPFDETHFAYQKIAELPGVRVGVDDNGRIRMVGRNNYLIREFADADEYVRLTGNKPPRGPKDSHGPPPPAAPPTSSSDGGRGGRGGRDDGPPTPPREPPRRFEDSDYVLEARAKAGDTAAAEELARRKQAKRARRIDDETEYKTLFP